MGVSVSCCVCLCSCLLYLRDDGPPTHPSWFLWHVLPYATSRPALAYRRAYDGSVTAVPNEIKMLKYNLVIVELPRRGGWIPGVQIVRVLSQGVLGAFHGHHGDLVAVEQHLRSQLEDLYPTALRMAVYHLGRREDPYLFEQSTLLLVKTHGLRPRKLPTPVARFCPVLYPKRAV